MSDLSKRIFEMAAEEQIKQQSSLCDRLGHPVYPVGGEKVICPRCDVKVVGIERRMNPKSVSLEEFNKETKVKILGSEEKPTSFINAIQTEEIV
jgi:uncharacterized Zn finger protein (UPF0148 family)